MSDDDEKEMSDDDEKEITSFVLAVAQLPDNDRVHTFRQVGGILLGADYGRPALILEMQQAKEIHVTGPAAQAMNHGLAIFDDHGWLFIETKA